MHICSRVANIQLAFLSEMPYFFSRLKTQSASSGWKDAQVKLKKIVNAFSEHAKNEPELLYNSKNYEETLLDFCDQEDKILLKTMFKNYYS